MFKKILLVSSLVFVVGIGLGFASQFSFASTPVISNVYFTDWDSNTSSDDTEWWSGAYRNIQWTRSTAPAEATRIGIYLCKNQSYTLTSSILNTGNCTYWGGPTVLTDSHYLSLGNVDGRLYSGLETAQTNPSSILHKYYTQVPSSEGNKYGTWVHVCILNSAGAIVGDCASAKYLLVVPKVGFNNGWTEWGRCSQQTTCGVAGTQTRTCKVAPCSGSASQACYKPGCGSISNLDVRNFDEATGYWLKGQTKTVTWSTTGTVDRVSLAICGVGQVGCSNILTSVTNNSTTSLTLPSDFGAFNQAYVRLSAPGLADVKTANFKVGPATGVYSNWSICSATTCDEDGTQTRTCLSGACSGPLIQDCVMAGCAAQPSISNFSISGTPLFSIPGLSNGKGWPAGTEGTLSFDYRDFSAGTKSVATSICHPVNTTTCTPFSNESITFSAGSGAKTLTRTLGQTGLYQKLLDRDPGPTPYYLRAVGSDNKTYFEADFRLCVVGNGICQDRKFYVAEPGGTPVVPGMPTVRNVRIDNLESGTIWRAGLYKNIRWGYNWFNSPSPKTVSLSLCHKDDTDGTRCKPWSGVLNNPADNQIASWTGSQVGDNRTNNRRIHPDVYDWLVVGRRDSNLSLFDAGGPPFQAKVRICPTYSPGHGVVGATVGQNVNPSLCAYSPVFSIGQNPNRIEGPGYSLPSGQGCFVGECVCINGQKARCGNPMRSGATCPAMTGCPGVLTVTPADKMLASVSWVFDWIIGIFKK